MDNSRKGYLLLFLCIIINCNVRLFAQDNDSIPLLRTTNSATIFGIGSSNLYDTYLSPLEYKGTSLRIMNERIKQISWFGNNFTRQQLIELEYAKGMNPVKNASEYFIMLSFNWGGHYNLVKTDKFRFSAGALSSTSLGVLYNARNSNNPASARAYSNISLSVVAFYNWKQALFRWQLDSPVAGVLFSPHYGQSYYEMSLGNTVGTVNFASFHNQRALRNYVTVDIPVNRYMFRLGYLGSYYQTKVSDLQTHNYSHSIVLGFVVESLNISGNKIRKNKQLKSSYYF